MKQKKGRLFALLMTMMAIALIVSACGGNSGGSKANEPANNPPEASNVGDKTKDSAASDLKPYKLKVVYHGVKQANEEMVEEALNKVLTEKINATIDIIAIEPAAWTDKMNLMIASREEADVMFTAQWVGYSQNVAKGAYLPIEDLLQSHGKGILQNLDPKFLEGSKIKDKNYGIPTNKELAAAGGIVYRKDIADELGLDMSKVKTPEDLDAIYAVVKEKKPEMTPLYTTEYLFNAHFLAEYDYMGSNTVPGVILKNGNETTVRLAEELDIYKRYLKIARDFYKKGYINADAATTQLFSIEAWKAGNVFSTIESLKPGKATELGNATGLPGKLDQIYLTGKTVSTSETAGAMLAISSTSKDPERAMMFINLLHTDKEVNNLMVFGIEGVHYTRNGEIISRTDKTPDFSHGRAWMMGSMFLNYVWDTEDPEKWNKLKEFNQNAKASPALGFIFDSEPVKAEAGALANVIAQYRRPLETGSVDPDKVLPEYLNAMKAAGVDKIIAEKQKQLDEYLSYKN